MQTNLAEFISNTPEGATADRILRSCVHCGFCTATCPTYQLLGDELEGPRGRIYLIKQVLEGQQPGRLTQLHLDHCLTCRSCETTCPSGVQYGQLVDIGRAVVEQQVNRPFLERLQRRLLRLVFPFPRRVRLLMLLARAAKPLLPATLGRKIPFRQMAPKIIPHSHARRMLLLDGCVQPVTAPAINAAAIRVFDGLGIQLETLGQAGCCGAVSYHLSAQQEGLDFMRRNIDAWWPAIEAGAEAIVTSASGCGLMVREYGELLAHDPFYAEKAARVSAMSRDLVEILGEEEFAGKIKVPQHSQHKRVAFHEPCTLQHGLKQAGRVRQLLEQLGFEVTRVRDNHLCCGSAGTYSILQPELSRQLLDNKVEALEEGKPDLVATANIGCLMQLQSGTDLPVRHWIELLSPEPLPD